MDYTGKLYGVSPVFLYGFFFTLIGAEAIREMFTAEFSTADMTAIVENIFEDGQWAILEWKDPLGLRGCGFFHVVNGKILFQRGYWDKLSFLKQHNLPIE